MNLFSSEGPRGWSDVLGNVDSVVSEDINALLLAPVTEDEVHQAVVQLGLLKAPGPDGFPGVFYQKFWPIVKDIVSGAPSSFLNGNDQI